MTYFDYLNRFGQWLEEDNPTDKAIILYYAMLNMFNRRGWPEWAGVDTQRLMMMVRTTDRKTAFRARDALVQKGFLDYKAGKKGKCSEYRLLEYGGKSTTESATQNATKNATRSATKNATPNKTKTNTKTNIPLSGGGDAHESAELEVTAFSLERGTEPSAYFGMTPEIKSDVELLTRAIFRRFATREPTEEDFSQAFFALYHSESTPETGQWTMVIPRDKKDLLMYAFEQAAGAGKPADWRYINGILGRLCQRGITTLEQADDFDCERKR